MLEGYSVKGGHTNAPACGEHVPAPAALFWQSWPFSVTSRALIQRSLVFYKPTGPLSGVTTVAILVWLVTWVILEWSWRKKTLPVGRINAIALALLVLSLILTFPPVGDLF